MNIFDTKPGTDLSPWSGQSTLHKSKQKRFNCDNCGLAILRHPSKCRGKTIACSRSCAAILRRVRVKANCAVCGKEMEQIPSRVGWVITCSDDCQKMRRAYDVIKNAPRFDSHKQTRSQFCDEKGLTRSQFRHRAKTGQPLNADLVHECGVADADSDKSWASMSACARELGVRVTAVHAAVKRQGRCKGIRLVRTTSAMSRGK